MANVQYAVLLLILIMAVLACNGTPERTRCTSQSPCFDLLIFERMAQRVSNYVVSITLDIRRTGSGLISFFSSSSKKGKARKREKEINLIVNTFLNTSLIYIEIL